MYIAENFFSELSFTDYSLLFRAVSKHREADWAGGINFIGSPNKKMQQLAFFHLTMLVGGIFLYMSKTESKTLSQKQPCLSINWCQNQAPDSSKTQKHKPHPGWEEPPRHIPGPWADRVGVHCLWYPLGGDTGGPSAIQAPSLLLPLQMKPAPGSSSALRLLKVYRTWKPLLSFSPTHTEPDQNDPSSINWERGFGWLCNHICNQNTQWRIMWGLL